VQFTGQFSDGKSAVSNTVAVDLTATYLHIYDAGGALSLLWPYGDLELIASEVRGGPVRLTRRTDPAPRLHVADPALLDALLARIPAIDPKPQRIRRTVAIVLGSLVCVPLLAAAVWFGLPLLAKPTAAVIPHAMEEKIGETVIDTLVGKMETCENDAGKFALERLVNRLWTGLDRPIEFDVRIVRSPMMNALAAPGGHILVFSELLDQADSPEELAGVLAHEIGHVVHRHSMQALVRHFALSVVVKTVSGNDWGLGSATQLLVQFAYSREAEAEADATAIAIMERARLRTDGLAQFFERVEQREKKDGIAALRYVSTHPPTNERIAALTSYASGADAKTLMPALSQADWAALKAICRKG
jgi:beta-barrel assembly-enhancing protease